MKIGILCYPTYGGSGIVATELGIHLANKGHEVHFISSSIPARLDVMHPNIYFHKVNVETYPLFKYQPYDIALSSTIYQIVKLYQLDVVHAHYAIPYAYAAYFAKQMLKEEGIHLPVITTLHGTDITLVGQHPSYKKAVEFSINQSDFVTSVSQNLKEDTFANFDIKKEIRVIPNFIDHQDYQQPKKCCREQFATKKEKILIHVSNLRAVKRIADVLETFKKVQKQVPVKLIIVGEGPELEKILSFIETHPQLMNKIKLMGKMNDLYSVIQYADVFLLPSEMESFGLAALEAMAARTVVISSNAGGIPEVNRHGFSGFTTDVGDIDAMVNYTVQILKDETKLAEMKENAYETSLQFGIEKIIPIYEQLYQESLTNL